MPEYWDITDDDGIPTGKTYMRGSPSWPEGGFHVVATICVVKPNNLVLLGQRAANREFALDWELPGGSVMAGEVSRHAAVRELHEEAGVVVSPDDLRLIGRYTEENALVDLYLARVPPDSVVTPDGVETVAYEWVTLDEVQRRLRNSMMAAPWEARLARLWKPLTDAIESAAPSWENQSVRREGQ